ncbi:MAG: hypothetical protein AMXMBFR19_21240 [Chthonomonadaceae bacterium]
MEVLGATLVRKLGALTFALTLLQGLVGCKGQAGPNDPPMTPQQEEGMRAGAYTDEQRLGRAQRPK